MEKRANSYDEWFKATTDERRAFAERMLGDARSVGVPEEVIKGLLVENVKVEVKEELGEKRREEKREDERRDARRDGERGERPGHELPDSPNKPSNELPGSVNRPSNELPGSPNRPSTLPGATPEPKKR